MNAKRTIVAIAVIMMAIGVLAIAPVTDDDGVAADEKETVYVHGELTSSLICTTSQIIVVDADLVIKDGATMEVLGDFIVSKGITVIIEGADPENATMYSSLLVKGDAIIDGNIISKTTYGLMIAPAESYNEAVINGTVTASGNGSGTETTTASISASTGSVSVNGTVTSNTNAIMAFAGDVSFETGSNLFVYGNVNGSISTSGYVLIDGKATLTVYYKDVSAVIDIKSVEGIVTVGDRGMFAYAYGGVSYYVALAVQKELEKSANIDIYNEVRANSVSFQNISNVRVTEKVITEIIYNESDSQNMMVAETETIVSAIDSSKTVQAIDGTENPLISTTDGDTVYLETMTLVDVDVSIGSGATVRGTVTYPLQTYTTPTSGVCATKFTVTGFLTVSGCLILEINDLDASSKSNTSAAWYEVNAADNKNIYRYTTLQQAIDDGAKNIAMSRMLTVDRDITVPAPVKVTLDKDAYYAIEIVDGATLTISDGAKLSAKDATGTIVVDEGALVYENINSGITVAETIIKADIKLQSEQYVMYTDIYSAIAKAKAGDELKAFQPSDGSEIYLDKDLTLPIGVTYDNNAIGIYLSQGVTFTIAGTLHLDDDSFIHPSMLYTFKWNSKTPATDSNGVLQDYCVLALTDDGMIEIEAANGYLFNKKMLDGAYFDMEVDHEIYHYITKPALAFSKILDVNDRTVTLNGTLTLNDLKVSGTEKEHATVNIYNGSDITMSNFTFECAEVIGNVGVHLTGDIGAANGKMIFNQTRLSSILTFKEVFINDAMNFEVSSGIIYVNNVTSISGTVYMEDIVIRVNDWEEGYSVETYDDLRFIVPAGASLFTEYGVGFDVELLVEGELTVTKDSSISTDVLSVLGKMTIDNRDGESGGLSIGKFIIGGSTDSFGTFQNALQGNAVVTGAGCIDSLEDMEVYLFNGSTVTADVLCKWMEDVKSTQFFVDDVLWMTAYVDQAQVPIKKDGEEYNFQPVLENTRFNGWQTYNEKLKTYSDIVAPTDGCIIVGQIGYGKAYADIDKDIFKVVVTADIGIDNIYIDGKIMLKDKKSNQFVEYVAAGTHTFTYALANGYSGEASITSIDGKAISGSGLTFVVSDKNCDDNTMEIGITGIQKSGIDTDPDTHIEQPTGLSTTEILLIVTVIIISIMAVVLILRLNRS